MKTSLFSSALTAIFLMTSLAAFAQKTNTWKGGTPGMENEWNCAKNWSTYSVPDEFTDVVIPDVSCTSFSAPLVKEGRVNINSLYLESNALLTIGKGANLLVFGAAEGVNEWNIKAEGSLFVVDELNEVQVAIAMAER